MIMMSAAATVTTNTTCDSNIANVYFNAYKMSCRVGFKYTHASFSHDTERRFGICACLFIIHIVPASTMKISFSNFERCSFSTGSYHETYRLYTTHPSPSSYATTDSKEPMRYVCTGGAI